VIYFDKSRRVVGGDTRDQFFGSRLDLEIDLAEPFCHDHAHQDYEDVAEVPDEGGGPVQILEEYK
jgi:hypothetical protein